MRINTGIKADQKFKDILNSVIGQMSDGIWENTRSMEKYWKSLDYVVVDGYIVIDDRHYVCSNPVDFFANKIKQIIKIEIEDGHTTLDWNRNCSEVPHYIHGCVTVGDCYKLYELLKGRDTTKHHYATYETYRVRMVYDGMAVEMDIDALNQWDAEKKAKERLMKKLSCTVYK